MKKIEFLANENIPQFIKDLVKDTPDDVEIGMEIVGISHGKRTAKEEDGGKCKCCKAESEEQEGAEDEGEETDV